MDATPVIQTRPLPDREAEPRKNAFLVFQGGGAKGIVHVGALAATEGIGIDIKGVAGTSAGGLIAALIAAGYSSKELFDPSTGKHIIGELSPGFAAANPGLRIDKATDLLTPGSWFFVRTLRWILSKWGSRWLGLAIMIILVCLVALDIRHPFLAFGIVAIVVLGAILVGKKLSRGVGSVKRVREFVDYAIRAKLAKSSKPGVTFRDFHLAGGKPLKIVATNVSNQCVEVFSYQRTPDVAIADAVAASICLPVVFSPWKFDCQRSAGVRADRQSREFLDGGITSNLPVWTLDRERGEDAETVTIAFSIQPGESEAGHWIKALASAIMAGSMEIHTRAVSNMFHIPIASKLNMLAFDTSLPNLRSEVARAQTGVREQLVSQVFEFPRRLKDHCSLLATTAMSFSRGASSSWFANRPENPPLFNVALALQAPHEWHLSIPYRTGFGLSDSRPRVTQDDLLEAWDTLEVGWTEAGTDCYCLLVPISKSNSPDKLEERAAERPLVVVVQIDNILVKTDPQSEALFADFAEVVSSAVESLTFDTLVYEAVQKSTEIS